MLPIGFGVPQGSVIGPTLFILYVSDLLTIPGIKANVVCYADDTALVFQDSTWEKTIKRAEEGLRLIADWLDRNLLTLNVNKTKYITFYKTRAAQPLPSIELKLHGHKCPQQNNENNITKCSCDTICRTDNIKYLGIVIDKRLTYENHISALSKRIRKSIFIMKTLRHCACKDTLILVYRSLCQSLLIYCIRVWGGAAKSFLIEVERAQRAVLKVMIRKPILFPTNNLYNLCPVLRVRQLYILRIVSGMHRLIQSSPEYLTQINRRRHYIHVPAVQSSFAKHQFHFLSRYLYNTVCKRLYNVMTKSSSVFYRTVEGWLLGLDYGQTEGILPSILT